METLLSITASNNSTLLKNKSDIIDNSTNNVTTNFIANVKNIFENQKKNLPVFKRKRSYRFGFKNIR